MEISLRHEFPTPDIRMGLRTNMGNSRTSNSTEAVQIVPFLSAEDHRVLAISHDTTLQRAMLVSVVNVHSADSFLFLWIRGKLLSLGAHK